MSAIFWLWVSWGLFCLGLVMAGASAYAGDVEELKRSEMTGGRAEQRAERIEQGVFYLRVVAHEPTDSDVVVANRIADIMVKQWREIREIYKKR